MIALPNFREVLKNFLYRSNPGDTLCMNTLLDTIKTKYKDLRAEVRYDDKKKVVKDLFLTFKNRINEGTVFILTN